ncbi:hypothetical protein EJB05_46090, partial [Eragrostis curvula]
MRITWLLLLVCCLCPAPSAGRCKFPAVFNFGDSNSDTGGFWAAFPAQPGPFGMTYFRKPAGRAASHGAAISEPLPAVHRLGLPARRQLRDACVYGDAAYHVVVRLWDQSFLPRRPAQPDEGIQEQSDQLRWKKWGGEATVSHRFSPVPVSAKRWNMTANFLPLMFLATLSIQLTLAKTITPQISDRKVLRRSRKVSLQLSTKSPGQYRQDLYNIGARNFMVFNMAPIGCYPAFLTELPHSSNDLDEYGCMKTYNSGVTYYNELLKNSLAEVRKKLHDSSIVYVDKYSVILELFRHPNAHGLKYGTKACCGYGGGAYNFNQEVYCGNSKVLNGQTATGAACGDPQNHVSWDGIHTTEAANVRISYAVMSGSYSYPAFGLSKHCSP